LAAMRKGFFNACFKASLSQRVLFSLTILQVMLKVFWYSCMSRVQKLFFN